MTNKTTFAWNDGWASRAKAFGLAIAFLILWGLIAAAVGFLLVQAGVAAIPHKGQHQSLAQVLLGELVLSGSAVLALLIFSRFSPSQLSQFGFKPTGWSRDLLLGILTGLGTMTAVLLVMKALGGFEFGTMAIKPGEVLKYAVEYAAVFSLVAVTEELSMRSYSFVQLSRAVTAPVAALLLAILFGAAHMGNGGENVIGVLMAGSFGLVAAYTFFRSGALWFALGLHAAWDYAESFLYGVPDSGLVLEGTLMKPVFHGPQWLTGGAAGPEGSVLALAALVLMAGIARVVLPKREVLRV